MDRTVIRHPNEMPAVDDCLAKILVQGYDTNGNLQTFAYIEVYVGDPTQGCHAVGKIVIRKAHDGILGKAQEV